MLLRKGQFGRLTVEVYQSSLGYREAVWFFDGREVYQAVLAR